MIRFPSAGKRKRHSAAEVSGEMDAVEVKVEDFDGTYACVICSESVRGGDALHCAQCSSNPVHVACVRGSPFAETCAQCSGKTMRPWTGRAGGGAPSSATIDLVAAEPAASGKGKEILDAQKEECASKDSADKDKDAGLPPSVSTQKKKAQSASKGDEHSDEDDDEDFDMAMAVRMLQKVKKLERAAAAVVLQCDTPPEQQEPPPCGAAKAEDPPRDPLSHKKKNKRKLDDEPLQQRTDKPARGCSSSGGGSSSRSSAQTPRRDAKAMYERKRWKVTKIVDTQRSDGSWALTVRLRRKRALCEGE